MWLFYLSLPLSSETKSQIVFIFATKHLAKCLTLSICSIAFSEWTERWSLCLNFLWWLGCQCSHPDPATYKHSVPWVKLLSLSVPQHLKHKMRIIPGTGEPDGLPSMGSHRVGHDWSDLAAAAATVLTQWSILWIKWYKRIAASTNQGAYLSPKHCQLLLVVVHGETLCHIAYVRKIIVKLIL